MNKTITIYELLGMVKDGKQPKHIKYRGEEWWWGYDTYTYFSCLEQTPDAQINMFTKYVINYCLDDEVEIIEDNDKLKHGENYVDFADLIPDSKFDYLYEMESKIIDHINKIEERLDER